MRIFIALLLLSLYFLVASALPQPSGNPLGTQNTTTDQVHYSPLQIHPPPKPAHFTTSILKKPSTTNLTHSQPHQALQPRQCTWNSARTTYDCDNHWPTIPEMVARMRDTSSAGGASASARVYFYSNLRDLTPEERNPTGLFEIPNRVKHLEWMEGWMKNQAIPSFMYANAVTSLWFRMQEEHVISHWRVMDRGANRLRPGTGAAIKTENDAFDIFVWCFLQAMAMAAQHEDAYLFTQRGMVWSDKSVWARVEYWKLMRNQNVKRIWRVDPAPGACNDRELLWERGRDQMVAVGWECPVL